MPFSAIFLGLKHTPLIGGVLVELYHIYIHLKLGEPLTAKIEEIEAETASFLKKMSRHSAGPLKHALGCHPTVGRLLPVQIQA